MQETVQDQTTHFYRDSHFILVNAGRNLKDNVTSNLVDRVKLCHKINYSISAQLAYLLTLLQDKQHRAKFCRILTCFCRIV